MEDYVKQSAQPHTGEKLPSPSLGESFPKIANESAATWSTQYTTQHYPTSSNCNAANEYHQMQQYHPNNSLPVSAKYWS